MTQSRTYLAIATTGLIAPALASVNEYGVAHRYETYEGNHTNRVAERFEGSVLPFFSNRLEFDA